MMAKRYLVTGAAGHLGSTILRMLSETDAEVYGLLLPEEQPVVISPQIHYYEGDVCDRESLCGIFDAASDPQLIVIHTAAVISFARRATPRLRMVNIEGTKNVLSLCSQYHVKRMVHVSSVHAIPELPKGQTMREVSSFSPELVTGAYAKTKAEAAQAVLDAAANGLDAVIVLPSGILGPYDSGGNHLIQMVIEYLNGKLPACVKGGYDFVDVRDVARGCLEAAEKGVPGNCYILSGAYCSIHDLIGMAGKSCGRKPLVALPVFAAHIGAVFAGLRERVTGERALFTGYSLHTISGNSSFSNEKARTELGYRTRALQETVADMVDWVAGKM